MSNSKCPFSSEPLATRAAPQDGEDLTGRLIGSLTVIGYARSYPRAWVVRCSCGSYTLRSSKAIRIPANAGDKCDQCRRRPAVAMAQVDVDEAQPVEFGSKVDLESLFAPSRTRRLRNVVTACHVG